MIHLGNMFEYACSPNENIRIINLEKLELLKSNILSFSNAVVNNGNFKNLETIYALLKRFNLTSKDLVKEYTIDYKVKNS